VEILDWVMRLLFTTIYYLAVPSLIIQYRKKPLTKKKIILIIVLNAIVCKSILIIIDLAFSTTPTDTNTSAVYIWSIVGYYMLKNRFILNKDKIPLIAEDLRDSFFVTDSDKQIVKANSVTKVETHEKEKTESGIEISSLSIPIEVPTIATDNGKIIDKKEHENERSSDNETFDIKANKNRKFISIKKITLKRAFSVIVVILLVACTLSSVIYAVNMKNIVSEQKLEIDNLNKKISQNTLNTRYSVHLNDTVYFDPKESLYHSTMKCPKANGNMTKDQLSNIIYDYYPCAICISNVYRSVTQNPTSITKKEKITAEDVRKVLEESNN